MTWLLERGSDRLTCEIRRSIEDDVYEFELAAPGETVEMHRFESASQLIDEYLRRQAALQADGWRPRVEDAQLLN